MIMAKDKKKNLVSKVEDLQGLGPVSLEKLYLNNIIALSQVAAMDPIVFSELTGLPLSSSKKIISQACSSFTFNIDTARELVVKGRKMKYCSTNSIALDTLLGGGLEEGSTTEFYGAFGSGKTQVVFSTIACFLTDSQFENKKVLIIDTENTFIGIRLEQVLEKKNLSKEIIEKLLERVYIFKPKTVEQQMIILSRLREEGEINSTQGIVKISEIKYLAVDSLVSLFRASFLGRGTLQERQQKINLHLSDLGTIVKSEDMFCIITNQVVSSPDPYSPDIIPVGGNIVAHASTHRIRLKRFAGGYRSARIMDSPSMPEEEIKFRVDQTGLRD